MLVSKDNKKCFLINQDSPKFIFLCPFLFWFFPKKAYIIENEEMMKQLTVNGKEVKMPVSLYAWTTGISIFLSRTLNAYIKGSDNADSMLKKIIISGIAIMLILLFRLYMNKRAQEKVADVIDLTKLKTEKIYIQPCSIFDFYFRYLPLYLFCAGLTALFYYIYMLEGNWILSLIFSILLLVFLLLNRGNLTSANQMQFKVKKIDLGQ